MLLSRLSLAKATGHSDVATFALRGGEWGVAADDEREGDGAALGSQERLQQQERKRGDAGAQMPPRSRDCTSWSPRREVPIRKLLLEALLLPQIGAEFSGRNLTNCWPQPCSQTKGCSHQREVLLGMLYRVLDSPSHVLVGGQEQKAGLSWPLPVLPGTPSAPALPSLSLCHLV